jgi:hypothetical protein
MNREAAGENNWKPPIFMVDYRSISWWYWLLSAGCLTAGVCGWPTGFLLAIGLTAFQLLHFTIRDRSVRTFPVQVRLGYLLLLLVAAPEKFQWIYWIPMVGTWVQVLFGYCAMARTVSLMPWNRAAPLSMPLLKQTFLSAPVRGSFLNSRAKHRPLTGSPAPAEMIACP